MIRELERLEAFLERVHRRKIQQNDDRMIIVLGDEGVGKSTFMLEAVWLWLKKIRDTEPSVETALDRMVWGERDEFREKLLDSDQGSVIAVQDAAHALMKKEVMRPEQVELEKSLLDIRIENFLILLGYQWWRDIPTSLQERRAETAFVIPRRGVVHGYSRSSIDHRADQGEWPEPDFRDRFPSLEGTKLWDRFEEMDASKKRERLAPGSTEEEQIEPREVVDEIIRDGKVEEYVDENEYNGQTFISKPLIRLDYPQLSGQQADQVKHGLRRETDVLQEEPTSNEAEGERGTP